MKIRRPLAVFLVMVLVGSVILPALPLAGAVEGHPTRNDTDWFTKDHPTMYGMPVWTPDWNSTDYEKYGYMKWDGESTKGTTTGDAGDYVKIQYPHRIYLDIKETLESAGYYLRITGHYGNDEKHRLIVGGRHWGEIYEGIKDGNYLMTELFSGYGHVASATDHDGVPYDNYTNDNGEYDTLNSNFGDLTNLDNSAGVFWNYAGAIDEIILLKGTPTRTADAEQYITAGWGGTFGEMRRWYNPNWIGKDSWHTMLYMNSDKNNGQKGGDSSFVREGYTEVEILVTIYDKSALNDTIAKAVKTLTQMETYPSVLQSGDANALRAQLNESSKVLTTREVTQTEVDQAKNDLETVLQTISFCANYDEITDYFSTVLHIAQNEGANDYTLDTYNAFRDIVNLNINDLMGIKKYYYIMDDGSGRNVDEDGGQHAYEDQQRIDNVLAELKAAAAALETPITLDAATNGGTTDPTTVDIVCGTNDQITFPGANYTAQKDGWNFAGWSMSADAQSGTLGDLPNVPLAATLYAIFTRDVGAVFHYMDADGSATEARDIQTLVGKQTETTIAVPTVPATVTKDGKTYTFAGWTYDANGFEADDSISGSLTFTDKQPIRDIYALYTSPVVLDYDVKGGDGQPAQESQNNTFNYNASASKGVTFTVTNDKPTREDSNFLGWADSAESAEPVYSGGETLTLKEDKTLYAVWALKTYELTFDHNDTTGDTDTLTKTHGQDLPFADMPVVTREGYTFLGWATAAEAQEPVYTQGSVYSENRAQTFYAVWAINKYDITFAPNGGTGGPGVLQKTHGEPLTIPSDTPTRDGYQFLGWATDPKADAPEYRVGEPYTAEGPSTLYAVWTPDVYHVSFNLKGGEDGPETQEKLHDIPLTLPEKVPTREGYAFVGWAESEDAAVATYVKGENWTFTGNADATLYAVWQMNSYTVEFFDRDGNSLGVQIVEHGSDAKPPEKVPALPYDAEQHYVFTGWDQGTTNITGDRRITAEYKLESHGWDNGSLTKKATCLNVSETTYVCAACSEEKIELGTTLDPTNHESEDTYFEDIRPATCTEKGYSGDEYHACCQTLAALGHETECIPHARQSVSAKAPTCTEPGYTAGVRCSSCGKTLEGMDPIGATGHKSIPVPGYPASCTTDGLTEGARCSVCNETLIQQEPIPATGHQYDSGVIIRYPMGGEKGVIRYTCTVCRTSYDVEVDSVAHEHTGGTATCVTRAVCSICGEFYGTTDPNKHGMIVIIEAVEPTCTKRGHSSGTRCADCGAVIDAPQLYDAVGHLDRDNDGICDRDNMPIPSGGGSSSSGGSSSGVFRCSLCDAYEANKDRPVVGLIYSIIHFIMHTIQYYFGVR